MYSEVCKQYLLLAIREGRYKELGAPQKFYPNIKVSVFKSNHLVIRKNQYLVGASTGDNSKNVILGKIISIRKETECGDIDIPETDELEDVVIGIGTNFKAKENYRYYIILDEFNPFKEYLQDHNEIV